MEKTIKTVKPRKPSIPKSAKSKLRRNKDHDTFVRGILGINSLVLKILLHFIPKKIQPYMDFSTLKIFNDTQVNNKLKLVQADSIHECAMNVSELPEDIRQQDKLPIFRFCFLWEHKSSKPDEPIEFQVESYRQGIIRSDLRNQQIPSIVIPLLLYHGAEKWDKKLLYELVKAFLPPDLLEYVPHPKYIEIDLQAMSEQEIEDLIDLKELRAAFIALKHAHEEDFFKHDMKKVFKFVQEIPTEYLFQEFFKMLLEYMQRRSKMEKEEFDNIVEQNLEEDMATKRIFKTTFEVAEERAEARGEAKMLRKAIVLLLQTSTFTNSQIAKALEANEAFVATVRQELMTVQQQA
ncbi:MAG: Rpn family recombination-promoting nuclease/putative transposase [Saprospiraceae bacterium]|nr:Rpn family recombination-promoting nuclease/putative transposase [Saprospiraceae bacterium]